MNSTKQYNVKDFRVDPINAELWKRESNVGVSKGSLDSPNSAGTEDDGMGDAIDQNARLKV